MKVSLRGNYEKKLRLWQLSFSLLLLFMDVIAKQGNVFSWYCQCLFYCSSSRFHLTRFEHGFFRMQYVFIRPVRSCLSILFLRFKFRVFSLQNVMCFIIAQII